MTTPRPDPDPRYEEPDTTWEDQRRRTLQQPDRWEDLRRRAAYPDERSGMVIVYAIAAILGALSLGGLVWLVWLRSS